MHNTAQQEIKTVVNSTLKPILKELGYRKNGNTWNLRDGELTKVVNVQLSSGNSSAEAKFTINLGIYDRNFHKESLNAGRVHEENVKEYNCEIRQRLGTISHGIDFWWTIIAGRTNAPAAEDLKNRFIQDGLPWLDSFKTLEDEYHYFVGRGMHSSAFVAAYILKKDSLFEHLRKSMENANPYYVETIKKWMSQRGLIFEE
jgi:hypothetical protein